MSSFNPGQQLVNINSKITASLVRMSEVFRVLLQTAAQSHGLSATQLQLLLFINFHPDPQQRKAAFMAREFNVTKATISDSIKALEQKRLVERTADARDSRSFILSLTAKGQELAGITQQLTGPVDQTVSQLSPEQKEHFSATLFDLIYHFNKAGIIATQRMCYNCQYYSGNRMQEHFCNLLNVSLFINDLRLECTEFKRKQE
ncbi:MarR family winged helix-turn-helix transcriptional regulator [Paraflavitalea speifideaquila]|uniref:MarR family winged helix-turn-helix transcriptional regulator n=1 Tax=Paraflavitalea speifideaquila TaxID=3076558 RepID=UPI0028EA2A44|nr:MarR family transcriptional regulator [Paraflavitalea speifideiaquila]